MTVGGGGAAGGAVAVGVAADVMETTSIAIGQQARSRRWTARQWSARRAASAQPAVIDPPAAIAQFAAKFAASGPRDQKHDQRRGQMLRWQGPAE
jgi:hypothetical protein